MIFLGIDVGTTGTKVLAVDERGRVLGRGYREYSLEFPQPGWVTQDAADWWQACVEAVRAALPGVDAHQVAAIGLSTQGATMLPVDANGRPLCPALTWMDRRAQRESDELIAAIGEEALYHKAGWPPAPWLDAPKIAWLRRNQPEVFKTAALFVSTLEFMNFHLTGRWAIDPTNAAIRQLMDIHTGRWDAEILRFLDLNETRLPEILPSGACLGILTEETAKALGLPRVKVYNGAHDQYCAAMGSGVHGPGELLLATGTTWVTLGVTDKPCYTASRLCPGPFPLIGRYGVMASMVSAGSALKWWKGIAGGSYADMDRGAASRRESAADLLFYPYVAGAGALHPPGERAAVIGMTLRHDQYDLARALMEGVAFETRLLLEEFARQGIEPGTLIMTGGAAGSRLWSEIVGQVTGRAIVHTEETEGACLGAAMLAAVGEGIFADLNSCAAAMVRRRPFASADDSQQAFEFYEEKFYRYRNEGLI